MRNNLSYVIAAFILFQLKDLIRDLSKMYTFQSLPAFWSNLYKPCFAA